jgi:hypothetical protein
LELVFETDLSNKSKLISLLEADPYAEKSFLRNGYKIKEGSVIGQDKNKIYLYIKCSEDFALFAKEKLKDLAVVSSQDVSQVVIKAINEEENNAEIGFGSIFG